MNDADMKVEVNTNPPNANGQANEKRGFDVPLFELPKMAMPGVFRGIAEQSVVRARENYEKMKAASEDSGTQFALLLTTASLERMKSQ